MQKNPIFEENFEKIFLTFFELKKMVQVHICVDTH